ncbi:hypothetical protein [Leifsonia xyli]|uniref:hypothetical protein n=1 Tax=Leifsonia xyli TaxID=1575 RepID=UPI0002DC9E6F|nr:hypothetical protein [Leifsonia xyli]
MIADAPVEDLVRIEGNGSFPPQSANAEYLVESDTQVHLFVDGHPGHPPIPRSGGYFSI